MENHDIEGYNSGICGGAPITLGELIPFPPSHTFHHEDASQLAPAAGSLGGGDADPAEGFCILESGPLIHLSYEENGMLYQRVAEIASSFHQGEIEHPQPTMPGATLSVEDLVRIAASEFVGSRSDQAMPLGSIADITELSEEESESVELTQLLLEAAQNVADRLFDAAATLVQQCHWRSSPAGNPIQRLVFYYSHALRDRMDRETGRIVSLDVAKGRSSDLCKLVMTPSIQLAEFHRRMPFSQVAQFAGIQAIVEHLQGSRSIHVIDLAIKNGQQWTILMQALASRPTRRRVQRFKITAVATVGEQRIQQMGNRLVSFAEGLSLPCVFEVVVVPDLAQLSRHHIQIESGQSVAVLAEFVINTLAEPLNRLDSLIRTVRSLRPCIMVVGEIEGNMNSPVFVNRFVESLFYASTFFDCMEECMGRDEPTRKYGEATLFGESSKIFSAIDGRERIVRNMKVEVWRAYFHRMGMVEEEMSASSMYQANLVARKLPCWKPCTVKMNGKGLVIGWKGTQINSVTAWSFT